LPGTEEKTALVTIESPDGPPSLEAAAQQLGVRREDIDEAYGVVPIDPARGLYGVQVQADRLPHGFERKRPFRGPFANPEIAPFGPVEDNPRQEVGGKATPTGKPPKS
jgi:hypothetical protein